MEPEQQGAFDGAEQEMMVCPACLAQNFPYAAFCKECDAPLSAGAVLGPFEQIRAQRFIFHRATTGPSSLFIVFAMWAMFAPIILASGLMTGLELSSGYFSAESVYESAFSLFLGGLSIGLLLRVTANYRRRR
jgi:hypothetical protein